MHSLTLIVDNKNDEWNVSNISHIECELHHKKINTEMTQWI